MRFLLISCCFILINCSKVEISSNEIAQTTSNQIVSVSPTIQKSISLKPVTPNVTLNSKRRSYLNQSLPPQVREVLEKAEKFEVLAEVREQEQSESDLRTFQPNRIASVDNESIKKNILEVFYRDIATDEGAASCYEPHHGLQATYQEKTVDIEICFDCAKFYVKGSFGNFEGTIRRESRKSEDFFNQIIQNQSVELR